VTTVSLRERKKAMTRRSILDAAAALFTDRGFDNVTVAEIADAADVAARTLFTYFPSKEDLVVADTELIDALIARLATRAPGTSHAQAVVEVLLEAIQRRPDRIADLLNFHPAYGDSPALQSAQLRMWSQFEDRITAQLALKHGTQATPSMRLHAIQLVGIVRTLTSPELRAAIEPTSPDAIDALEQWLHTARNAVG
jgi:AcrR family transcriptional regulator